MVNDFFLSNIAACADKAAIRRFNLIQIGMYTIKMAQCRI